MNQQEQQLIDRIKQAQNVLVTVSTDPTVDQLAAAIGLTVALNKLDKHGTAVFSGQVPSTMEFLKPEETLEKNTDSLRDFIIALDKSKADKLRYKVEDQVVRIFITPYKTSLSEKDLDFSQGDFNVDVVIALGVAQQQDIDAAITAHGRILHDATVASVSVGAPSELGTINWSEPDASSLSEMVLGLVDGLDKKLLDNQIATALLTGIVASTDRFRNEKTSPKAMSASAELMAAGANPQLIATELETPPPEAEPAPVEQPPEEGEKPAAQAEGDELGTLDINHENDEPKTEEKPPEEEDEYRAPAFEPVTQKEQPPAAPEQPQINVDEDGTLSSLLPKRQPLPSIGEVHGVEPDGTVGEPGTPEVHHGVMAADASPTFVPSNLTANTKPEGFDPTTEELSLPAVNAPLLSHNATVLPPKSAPSNKLESPYIPQAPLTPPPTPMPAPVPTPTPPAPVTPMPSAPPKPPIAPASPPPVRVTPATPPVTPSFTPPPLTPSPTPPPTPVPAPQPTPVAPAVPLTKPSLPTATPNETLTEIEQSVHSPHVQATSSAGADSASGLDEARSAVQAALNNAAAPAPPVKPIAALNAQPLGPDLRAAAAPAPVVPNPGVAEPVPGNTPADATLDMPLPSNPFGPGQQTPPAAPPSSFPGTPPSPAPGGASQAPPPPVPPPMLPPLQ